MPEENLEGVPLNNLDSNSEHYREIFNTVDTNNDGYICVWELEDFIHSSNENVKLIPKHAIRKIHKMADDNGDRKLDYREFVNMLEHPDLQHLFGRYVSQYVNFIVPRHKRIVKRGRGLRAVEETQLIDEYTCCPPPVFMFIISILEVAFYLTDEITEKGSTLSGTGVTALIFIYDPHKREEVWRYLTYMFVHIGYTHLCVNLAVQLILGVPLEMVHKWWRVLSIYFAGVIAGSLANSITDPTCRLAGASGGVYALLTAHIACAIMGCRGLKSICSNTLISYPVYGGYEIISIQIRSRDIDTGNLKWFIQFVGVSSILIDHIFQNWSEMICPYIQILIYSLIVVCDLGQSIYDRYFLNVASPVGISAHLGGALTGFLVGIYTLRNLQVTKTEKYIWWIALILYIILMGTAIILNVAWPGYFARKV